MLGIYITHLYSIKYFWTFETISVEQFSYSAIIYLINYKPLRIFFISTCQISPINMTTMIRHHKMFPPTSSSPKANLFTKLFSAPLPTLDHYRGAASLTRC